MSNQYVPFGSYADHRPGENTDWEARKNCEHKQILQSLGSPFQYCADCGAVRQQLSGKAGQFDA